MCATNSLSEINHLIDCHRAILWSLYEYSLYRNEKLSFYIHTLLHQNRFECTQQTTTLILQTLLHQRLWKSHYDDQLPMAIAGRSRLFDLINRLTTLKKHLLPNESQSNEQSFWYQRIEMPDSAMLITVHSLIGWLVSNNNIHFMNKNLTIQMYGALLKIRLIEEILSHFNSKKRNKKKNTLISLQANVRSMLVLPKEFQNVYSLVKKNTMLKVNFEAIVKTNKRLHSYLHANARNDLLVLCGKLKKCAVDLNNNLLGVAKNCRPQIEILLNNIAFVDTELIKKQSADNPIIDFVRQLRQANQEGHLERLRILAENSCIKIDQLNDRKDTLLAASNSDVKVILDSEDEEETEQETVVNSQSSIQSTGRTRSQMAKLQPQTALRRQRPNVANDSISSDGDHSFEVQAFQIPLKYYMMHVTGGKTYKVHK